MNRVGEEVDDVEEEWMKYIGNSWHYTCILDLPLQRSGYILSIIITSIFHHVFVHVGNLRRISTPTRSFSNTFPLPGRCLTPLFSIPHHFYIIEVILDHILSICCVDLSVGYFIY